MNKNQRIVLIAGILLILINSLFIPWTYISYSDAETVRQSAGYYFLATTPPLETNAIDPIFGNNGGLYDVTIDIARYCIQYTSIITVIILLLILFNDKNKNYPVS